MIVESPKVGANFTLVFKGVETKHPFLYINK